MGKNGSHELNEDIVKLGQWEFHTVSQGLDRDQVASMLADITRERDALIERTEHLNSLTRLAERTVSEADRLAEETLNDALSRSQQEASRIIETAASDAQQQREQIRQLQSDFATSVRGLLSQLLTGLDGFTRQIKDLATEIESKLPEAAAAAPPPAGETLPETITPEPEANIGAEEPEPTPAEDAADEDASLLYELEILPPLDVMKIMDIVTYLDNMPEVKNTELIPNTERPSITVELKEPIALADLLRTLPELSRVEESAGAAHGLRRIQLSLSEAVAQGSR